MMNRIYYLTGKRNIYNQMLKYMVNVTQIVEKFEKGENLSDILNLMMDNQLIVKDQIPSIIQLILVERAKLPFVSVNLENPLTNFSKIVEHTNQWTAIDFVLSYYHPTYGIMLINPKNKDNWNRVFELKKDELVVIFARSFTSDIEIAKKALSAFILLFNNKEPDVIEGFILKQPRVELQSQQKTTEEEKKEIQTKQKIVQMGKGKLTPKYSVQVTNELFHNGNVEAWKNIIEAYEAKYKGCKVIVYHEGELIQDLNSLFKWGKVKHGGVIMFQVIGEDIKGVSRLQKYLYEGASPRFESFLKKDVNKILNIF